MQKKIGETSPEIWELMLKSTNSVATIPIRTEREDILFGLCGLYRKGIVELYLLSIQAPNIPKEELKPVTNEEWELAESKAKEILNQKYEGTQSAYMHPTGYYPTGCRALTPLGCYPSSGGLPPSPNGGKEVIDYG